MLPAPSQGTAIVVRAALGRGVLIHHIEVSPGICLDVVPPGTPVRRGRFGWQPSTRKPAAPDRHVPAAVVPLVLMLVPAQAPLLGRAEVTSSVKPHRRAKKVKTPRKDNL